jgi:hypothetical protein
VAIRVFLLSLLLSLGAAGHAAGHATAAPPTIAAPPATVDAPPPTFNEFLPEDRAIGDCISALPKPGCGSEARGGWHQYLVMITLVLGLAFVGWRVVVGLRRRPA